MLGNSRVAALDGLRAVAVGLVILFHYWSHYVPGGFVGVDIFFVLSGYLITGILLKELDTGQIKFLSFFRRRAARLAPALCLTVLVTVLVVTLFSLDQRRELWSDVAWVLTYTSNWKRAFIEQFGDSTFFNHTWSLGIEEQFYLSWPIILAVVWRRLPRGGLLLLVVSMIVAVTVWRWYLQWSGASFFRLYHGFDTRADQLLVGCALAIAISIDSYRDIGVSLLIRKGPFLPFALLGLLPLIGMLSPAALSIIGYMIIAVPAVVIIADCHLNSGAPLARLLSWPPIVYIGSISYGIYLWHIPIKSMFIVGGFGFSLPQKLIAVALTLIFASASFYGVERPLIRLNNRSILPETAPPRFQDHSA